MKIPARIESFQTIERRKCNKRCKRKLKKGDSNAYRYYTMSTDPNYPKIFPVKKKFLNYFQKLIDPNKPPFLSHLFEWKINTIIFSDTIKNYSTTDYIIISDIDIWGNNVIDTDDVGSYLPISSIADKSFRMGK